MNQPPTIAPAAAMPQMNNCEPRSGSSNLHPVRSDRDGSGPSQGASRNNATATPLRRAERKGDAPAEPRERVDARPITASPTPPYTGHASSVNREPTTSSWSTKRPTRLPIESQGTRRDAPIATPISTSGAQCAAKRPRFGPCRRPTSSMLHSRKNTTATAGSTAERIHALGTVMPTRVGGAPGPRGSYGPISSEGTSVPPWAAARCPPGGPAKRPVGARIETPSPNTPHAARRSSGNV